MKYKKTLISLIVALASTTCQVTLLNGMDNKGKNEPMGSEFLLDNVFENENKNIKQAVVKVIQNWNFTEKPKNQPCKHCSKLCTTAHIKNHEKDCRKNPNRINYKCVYCLKEGFGSQSNLNVHIKNCKKNPKTIKKTIKKTIIKYMCQCSMGFATQNSFDRHKNNCRVWHDVSINKYVTNYIATQKEKDKGKID